MQPSEYFKKLNLAYLDQTTAQFIREKVLTFSNIDLLEGTKEFEILQKKIETDFPLALGIEPKVQVEPIVKKKVEAIKTEPVVKTEPKKSEPKISKEKQIEEVQDKIIEILDMIDLLTMTLADKPDDIESKDMLELMQMTLPDLQAQLESVKKMEDGGVLEGKYVYKFNDNGSQITAYVMDLSNDKMVWEFYYPDITLSEEQRLLEETPIDSGFMKTWDDVSGLENYLKDLQVIPADAELVSEQEAEKFNDGGNIDSITKGTQITFKHDGDVHRGEVDEVLQSGKYAVGFLDKTGMVLVDKSEIISVLPKLEKTKKKFVFFEDGGTIDSDRRFTESDFNKLVDKSDLKGIWNGTVWEIVNKNGGGFVYGRFNPHKNTLFIAGKKDLSNPLVKWLQENSFVSADEYTKLENGGLIIDDNWGNDGSTPSNNEDYNNLYAFFPDNHTGAKAIWNQLSDKQKEGFINDLQVTDAASEHIAEAWLEFVNAESESDWLKNATNWDEMKQGGEITATYIGEDDWSRRLYKGSNGKTYVDVDGALHTITNEGEPNYPVSNIKKIDPINETSEADKFQYMMLDRLRSDVEYYLGHGNRNEKNLRSGSVDEHIAEMKRIWNNLPEKPEWLSMEDILEYETKMKEEYAKGGGVGKSKIYVDNKEPIFSKGDVIYIQLHGTLKKGKIYQKPKTEKLKIGDDFGYKHTYPIELDNGDFLGANEIELLNEKGEPYQYAKGGGISEFNKQFNIGDVVWDKEHKSYGIVLNNYGDPINGSGGEIRLDSDGNVYIFTYDKDYNRNGYNLIHKGEKGDEGNGDLTKLKKSAQGYLDYAKKNNDKDLLEYYNKAAKRLLEGEFDSKNKKESIKANEPDTLGGWSKDIKETTKRRRLALASRSKELKMKERYLSAGQALQTLSNLTKDAQTKKIASNDAKYFFTKAKK